MHVCTVCVHTDVCVEYGGWDVCVFVCVHVYILYVYREDSNTFTLTIHRTNGACHPTPCFVCQ